jgi:hypothetical protein
LLYPCEIRADLTPSGLRSAANAFDPKMAQADYNSTPINISGQKALWDELENMTFAIYQPSKRTAAIIFFDEGTPYGIKMSFLESLMINVSDQSPQKYCIPSGIASPPDKKGGEPLPLQHQHR